MKNSTFEIKRSLIIFRMEFLRKIKNTLIWSAATTAMMFLYLMLYSSMEDLILEKLEDMPAELLSIMGISGTEGITNFMSYFGMIYGIFVLVFSIYSIVSSCSLLYEEEKSGTIEFLNAQEVSRLEIYVGKLLVLFANILIVILCSYIAIIISGYSVAPDIFSVGNVSIVVFINLITILFFAAVGFFLSTVLKKTQKPSSITLGLFLVTYLLGYLGDLLEDRGTALGYLSPIHITQATKLLNSTMCGGMISYNFTGLIVISVFTIVLFVAGAFTYNKKDF